MNCLQKIISYCMGLSLLARDGVIHFPSSHFLGLFPPLCSTPFRNVPLCSKEFLRRRLRSPKIPSALTFLGANYWIIHFAHMKGRGNKESGDHAPDLLSETPFLCFRHGASIRHLRKCVNYEWYFCGQNPTLLKWNEWHSLLLVRKLVNLIIVLVLKTAKYAYSQLSC